MSEAVRTVSRPKPIVQWSLVVVLAVVVAIAALPSYFSGSWPWSSSLKVPQIEQLKALEQTPLNLPGWTSVLQHEVNLNGSKWSFVEYHSEDNLSSNEPSRFWLLLRPQSWHDRQPQVEWVDVVGALSWQVDDLHHLSFSVSEGDRKPQAVTTRYFRGVDKKGEFAAAYLDEQRTLAVMQWYAWPTGGHSAPGKWFWADQSRQWSRQERMPWVAVSILLPIEPVGNIRPYADAVTAIGQTVQSSLIESAF